MPDPDIDGAHSVPHQDHGLPAVSRRTLVKTAAGVGVAAATVGAISAGGAVDTAAAASSPHSAEETARHGGVPGPVVVHVRDLSAGTLEIFTDGGRSQVTDVDLANRIVDASNRH